MNTSDIITIVFCCCYVVFAFSWDSPLPVLASQRIRSRLNAFVQWIGFDHSWKMFAHDEFTSILNREVFLVAGDKKVPAEIPPVFEFKRWLWNMGSNHHRVLLSSFLEWVAKNQSPHLKFDSVELVETLIQRHPNLSPELPVQTKISVLASWNVPHVD